jgi:hypothetical protein
VLVQVHVKGDRRDGGLTADKVQERPSRVESPVAAGFRIVTGGRPGARQGLIRGAELDIQAGALRLRARADEPGRQSTGTP